MKSLEINNNILRLELKSWEAIFWPQRIFEIPFVNIKEVTVQSNMPADELAKPRPIANLPGILYIGEFYPIVSLSSKKLREVRELWCFNFRNKSFLTLVLENESHNKIVLGMSKEQGEEWFCKISSLINRKNGNCSDN
jgi:hypothetical protein